MVDLVERLRNRAFRLATRDFNGDGAKLAVEAATEIELLRAALEAIQSEAERENGGWVHMKRCIAVQARQALKGPTDE